MNSHYKNIDISELWIAHSQLRFPKRYCGIEINGIDLWYEDLKIAGCVSFYIKHEEKTIDLERYQVLIQCKVNIEKALLYLDPEDLDYFESLHQICSIIITEASII